jgi:uncharacterized protein (TIGR00730 family)
MKRVTVFCGASEGNDEKYIRQAEITGSYLASSGYEIVFGGGKIGIMGAVANAALKAGGRVTGVIPSFLKTKEVAHDELTTMHTVENMHERKLLMHELGDAVLALPGGYGTLEELFEMLTWAQLGLHKKPIGLLNTGGYYNHLIQFIHHMYQEGFINETNRDMILIHENHEILLSMMERYVAPDVPQWIQREDV